MFLFIVEHRLNPPEPLLGHIVPDISAPGMGCRTGDAGLGHQFELTENLVIFQFVIPEPEGSLRLIECFTIAGTQKIGFIHLKIPAFPSSILLLTTASVTSYYISFCIN